MIPIKTRHMILLFLGALAIAMAIFWYNYSALGYSLSDLTTFFLAKDSRIQERIILQPGTSTGVSIVAGTQTDTWLSNPDDLTLPRIELNGITGKWTFKHRDSGTTTNELSSLTQALADNRYVQQNAGTGSNNTFTNPTCSGGTQSGNTELIGNYIIGTETVAKQKTQYLADVTGYVQSQLNSKENSANKGVANGYASLDVNGKVVENPASGTETSGTGKIPIQTINGLDSWLVNMYVNKIRGSSGNTMEGQIDIVFEGDIAGTSTYDAGQRKGTQTIALSAAASAKPNIQEGGITIGTQSTEINFDADDFDVIQNVNQSNISFSSNFSFESIQIKGTTTPITGTSTSGRWYNLRQDNVGVENSALLLHMNNPGTSTFIDSSYSGYQVTANGNVIGTTTAKFGSGGGYFDGTGDYLSTPDQTDWAFGTGDFTIDLWVRFNTTAGNLTIMSQRVNDNNRWTLSFSSNTLYFQQLVSGSIAPNIGKSWTPSTGTWYHVALTREGNDYKFWVDGTQVGTTSTDATGIADIAAELQIGANGGLSGFNGCMDEVRISKGIARWTSNFTPPVEEYVSSYNYNYNSIQVIPPGTTTPAISIVDDGTNTTKNYILLNATTVGFGYGTTTDITGTTNTYIARGKQGAGGLLVDSLNTYSTEEIKSIVSSGTRATFLDTWKNLRLESWYRKKPEYINNPVDPVLIENQAKEKYKQDMYQLWYNQNIDKYKTTVDDGTGSMTTFIDVAKLEMDYGTSLLGNWYMMNESAYTEIEIIAGQLRKIIRPDKLTKAFMDYGELLWMSELDQNKWLEKEKIEIESDTSKQNVSLIVNDPSTPAYMKTKDGIGRDLGSELGSLGIAFQELIKIVENQGREIESLRALLAVPTPTPTPTTGGGQ